MRGLIYTLCFLERKLVMCILTGLHQNPVKLPKKLTVPFCVFSFIRITSPAYHFQCSASFSAWHLIAVCSYGLRQCAPAWSRGVCPKCSSSSGSWWWRTLQLWWDERLYHLCASYIKTPWAAQNSKFYCDPHQILGPGLRTSFLREPEDLRVWMTAST